MSLLITSAIIFSLIKIRKISKKNRKDKKGYIILGFILTWRAFLSCIWLRNHSFHSKFDSDRWKERTWKKFKVLERINYNKCIQHCTLHPLVSGQYYDVVCFLYIWLAKIQLYWHQENFRSCISRQVRVWCWELRNKVFQIS